MSKLRKSARGQNCTLRLTGICNFNPETTVLAHIVTKGNSGMGMKPPDYMALIACSCCHDAIDGRTKVRVSAEDILRAHLETLKIWVDMGLIIIK